MDRAIDFLRELTAQQEREPDLDPTGANVADALNLDRSEAETTLDGLLADELAEALDVPKREGDGPLDAPLKITMRGRAALEMTPGDPGGPGSGPLEDTWHWRELPVLRAAVAAVDREPTMGIRVSEVAAQTGLDAMDVYRSAKALQGAGLVELREYAGPVEFTAFRDVSGHARTLSGQWPTEQTAVDRMLAALEAIADNTDEDDDTRSRARKVLDGLSGAGRQMALSVATTMVTGQMPGQ